LFLLVAGLSSQLHGQCSTNTLMGSPCTRSATYYGEVLPNGGCGIYTTVSNYSPGTHFRIPVLQGASYTVSTCGAPTNTMLAAFQGNGTTGPFAYNDDNGPECSGTTASMVMTPAFTDYARVDVREFNCSAGGTSSITVLVRQCNNISFTSSGASMCAGTTRALTATPAHITATPQPGSGNLGTFTGTGVVGTIFTAPTPSTSMQSYGITYTFGYCSSTQNIDVYRAPSVANAGANFNVCSGTATMGGNSPTYGTGTWAILSGPGSVTTPNLFNTTVTGLVIGSTTTLTWTIDNGPCGFTRDTVTVFRETPPSTASASPDQALCAQSTSVTGNAPTIGTGLWYLLGGSATIVTPTATTTSITAIGTGVNTVVWSITNGVCPASNDTVVITRDAIPTPAFAGPDVALCDSTLTLTGNLPAIGTGLWTVLTGSGVVSTPTNPNSPYINVPIGPTTLAWTISNGACPSSTDTLVVNRNNGPASPTIAGNLNVCEGSQTLLSASSGATIPNFTWWDAPTGGNLLASTAAYSTPPITANVTYYVQVEDAATSCSSARIPVSVIMVPNPVVNIGPDRTICDNDTACFNVASGLNTYIWTNGTTTNSACTADSGLFWVQVSDINNCIGRDTVHVSLLPSPSPDLGPDTTYCPGGVVVLGGFPVGNNYFWSTGSTSNGITVGTAGLYWVVCTSPNTCFAADSINVTQAPAVQAAFTVDTAFCPQIVFVDGSLGADTWSWSFGDNQSSTAVSPIHTYQGNNLFTVTLTVTGLCGTSTMTHQVTVDCNVGISLPSTLVVTVYPNPNDGNFKVKFEGLEVDASITIFNELGQQVMAQDLGGQRGDFETLVNMDRPAAGTYFVKLKLGDATVTKRILVR
jgi:hypothetical protein